MEIGSSVLTLLPGVVIAPAVTATGSVTPAVDPGDILCMQTITGSNTGTNQAVGGSANNCLDS